MVKIDEAAKIPGGTPDQLRRWPPSGELLPTRKTRGGSCYYSVSDLVGRQTATANPLTVCYSRVSSHDQKDDLDWQHAAPEACCAAKGWRTQVIRDLGSGMNCRKKGLQELPELILNRRTERLVVTHKDRLLRFGAELVFSLCELQGISLGRGGLAVPREGGPNALWTYAPCQDCPKGGQIYAAPLR